MNFISALRAVQALIDLRVFELGPQGSDGALLAAATAETDAILAEFPATERGLARGLFNPIQQAASREPNEREALSDLAEQLKLQMRPGFSGLS